MPISETVPSTTKRLRFRNTDMETERESRTADSSSSSDHSNHSQQDADSGQTVGEGSEAVVMLDCQADAAGISCGAQGTGQSDGSGDSGTDKITAGNQYSSLSSSCVGYFCPQCPKTFPAAYRQVPVVGVKFSCFHKNIGRYRRYRYRIGGIDLIYIVWANTVAGIGNNKLLTS